MPVIQFECQLGGVVILDCEVALRFGRVDRTSLCVTYEGLPFDCDGIVIDYEGEFLPLRTYLLEHAQHSYEEDKKHGTKKST